MKMVKRIGWDEKNKRYWMGLIGLDGMKRIKGIGWDEYDWME